MTYSGGLSSRTFKGRWTNVLARRQVRAAPGLGEDPIDHMAFLGGFESADRYEETIERIYKDAEEDAQIALTLRLASLERDVPSSLDFYSDSRVPDAIVRLLEMYGIGKSSSIVDVGCGRGHATYALMKRGFETLAAMDPNGNYSTGTGYLATQYADRVAVINSFDEWRSILGRFDAAISTSTVHHWPNIPHGAVDLRRTLKPGGYWFMITEYYANTPQEFFALLDNHPFAKRYGTYEWPYPASAYVDLVESVGMKLVAVVPQHYRGNTFYTADIPPPARKLDTERFSDKVDRLLEKGGTVKQFWREVEHYRRKPMKTKNAGYDIYAKRYYTNPQVMVFQRVAV